MDVNWDNYAEPTSPEQPQGTGTFYLDVSDLEPDTLYYCKPRAVNAAGAAWGGTATFTTLEVETEILRPDGTGNYTQINWQYPDSTYHWDKVDEVSTDDDGTYIFTNIPQYDAFTLGPSSVPSGKTIDSVYVHFRCRGDESGFGYAVPFLILDEEEEWSVTLYYPPAEWTSYEKEIGRPGGGSWSSEDFDELQAGIMLSSGISDYGYCTQIYVEILYYGTADPVVTTQDAAVTSNITATGNGNITGLIITPADERGFDWDIDSGEPYTNSTTDTGSYATGAYTKSITGMPAGTTIYYRAKAHNSAGWAYGSELTFLTYDTPTVVTESASGLSSLAAIINGNITSLNGDVSCTERGFVYDTVTRSDPGANPPASSGYSDNYTENGIYTLGEYNTLVSGLSDNTTYFVRAYAYNTYGYNYGAEISFVTFATVCWIEWEYGDTFTDLSGYGNDATPTFLITSSDADVSAVVTAQESLNETNRPTVAPLGGWEMIKETPEEPEGLYREGGTSFPGGSEIEALANETRLPVELFLYLLAFGTAGLFGVGAYALTHRSKMGIKGSLLIMIIVIEGVLVFWYKMGDGVISGWVLIPFAIIAIPLLLWRNPYTPMG